MKDIRLFAYEVVPSKLGEGAKEFKRSLQAKMDSLKTVGERRFQLHEGVKEWDCLLLNETTYDGDLFYLLARVKPSNEIGTISDEMLTAENLTMADLNSSAEDGFKSVKFTYYLIGDQYIISDRGKASDITLYANSFLKRKMSEEFRIDPLIRGVDSVKISEIKKIYIDNNLQIDVSVDRDSVKGMAKDFMKLFAPDSIQVDHLVDSTLVNVLVALKFDTKKINPSSQEKESLLSQSISFTENEDAVTIETKNGQRINGNQLHQTKRVRVDTLSDGKCINEQALKKEMRIFLNELER